MHFIRTCMGCPLLRSCTKESMLLINYDGAAPEIGIKTADFKSNINNCIMNMQHRRRSAIRQTTFNIFNGLSCHCYNIMTI